MKKITNVLLTIFSVGILLSVFCAALTLIGYVIAMIIGGEIATKICYTLLKVIMPWIIKATSVFAGFGLIGMYLSKVRGLSIK